MTCNTVVVLVDVEDDAVVVLVDEETVVVVVLAEDGVLPLVPEASLGKLVVGLFAEPFGLDEHPPPRPANARPTNMTPNSPCAREDVMLFT
jgi:hypothetical protein